MEPSFWPLKVGPMDLPQTSVNILPILYSVFWAISRLLNFICGRFEKHCLFHLRNLLVHTIFEDGRDRDFAKRPLIKFRSRGIAQKTEYKIDKIFTDVSGKPIGPTFKGQKLDRHVVPRNVPVEGMFHWHRGRNVKPSSCHLDAPPCYGLPSCKGRPTDRHTA